MRAILALAVLAIAGCSSGPPAGGPFAPGYRWVDLTYTFDEETIYWPTSRPFEHLEVFHGRMADGTFYSAYDFCAAEHGGTHLDAPIHFAQDRWTAERIPLASLVGPACVLDVTEECALDPDHAVPASRIEAWEARHGRVPSGSIFLLRTGWGRFWPDRKAYLGDDRPGEIDDLHFPGFSPGAARLLVERGVAMVGLDTASLDPGPSKDFAAHVVFASANVPGLENLARLEELPATGAWILALPMKIGGGSGAPVRVVAFVP